MKASSVSSQEPFNPFGLASKFGSFVLDNASNKANSYCQNNIQLYFDSKYSINKANVLPFLSLTSPRGGSWKNLEVFNQFNKFIRLHCEKIPLGFASLRVDSRESNGLRGDENNLLEGEGLSVHGARSDTPKKVLILMSDTGGGHRASAEAIKAAFYEQFGDEYQVFVVDLWTEHTPWPFNQLPRSYNFLVKHGTLWKMTYYASAPRLVHQTNFAATSTFIARIKNSNKFYSKHYWFLRLSIQIHTQISSQLSRGFSLVKTNEKLKGYFESGHVDGARKLFDKMPKRDEFTYNSMVAGFANAGRFNEAKQVFDETPKRSSITWSALISGYCKYGYEDESFDLFWRMRYEGERPSQYTLGSLLRLCSVKGFLSRGEKLHGFIIKTGFGNNAFVVTGLVDMYVKCYRIKAAEKLFRTMDSGKNHVTWTAIINGYSLNGNSDKTLQCFCQMRSEGIEANQYTFPSVLTACGSASDLRFGEQVHGCVVRGGFHANIFVQSALVDMYAKCGDLNCAKEVLESMEVLQVVAWNSMIVGYMRHGLEENALSLLEKMHGIGLKMDEFTYPSVLNALALRKDAFYGECLHCFIIKTGFCDHILVSNALVDMYAKQGSSIGALEVFNEIKDKDVISWTSMITGCTHNGSHEEALNFFQRMRIAGIYPDQVSVSSTLSSCAELTLHELGKQVHGNYIKSGPETSLSVDNSLLAMYAKCGCLDDAITVFYSMTSRNVMSWTAIIVGHAQNGRGKEALPFYDEMVLTGIKPDFITFIGLLFACSHAGLVDEGRQYFGTMIDAYGIQPGPDHYASMIDLLARSGKLQEAESLVNEMVDKPGPAVWKALLTACRKHGNMDIAKRAAMTLIELDPQDAFPYVILSNMYSAAGRWEDAAGLRRLMKLRGVIKEPGCSWIEINSKVHTFFSEDRSHPNTNEIYLKVNDIIRLIKEAGYVPDVKFSLHDVNEETKELGLAYHGEKLAIAFGLLYLPENAPIRIFKNLRVCGDCHNAMKIISKVFHRYIVLRDSNCFHHFKEGQCSCGDYW